MHYDTVPETAAEALAKWDRDDTVWTVEMGGLGPSYEQCIHIAAFELLRAMLFEPREDVPLIYERMMGLVLLLPSIKALQLSGSQAGAAAHLAANYLVNGYRATCRTFPEERMIQVTKYFPSGPVPTERPTERAA